MIGIIIALYIVPLSVVLLVITFFHCNMDDHALRVAKRWEFGDYLDSDEFKEICKKNGDDWWEVSNMMKLEWGLRVYD